MNIKYNNTIYTIPAPFDQCYFGSKPSKDMLIHNPYSQVRTNLPAFAVAIYDAIKGAERVEDYDTVEKGLSWFQKNFTEQYMVLLD